MRNYKLITEISEISGKATTTTNLILERIMFTIIFVWCFDLVLETLIPDVAKLNSTYCHNNQYDICYHNDNNHDFVDNDDYNDYNAVNQEEGTIDSDP